MKKLSASVGSAPQDPVRGEATYAPVPAPALANKPAPGQTGPRGLAPRTTYSRVNVGIPPTPDAGANSQKNAPPRGMEFLPAKTAQIEDPMGQMMTPRPTLQDMVKAAMAGTISKVDISTEADRQFLQQATQEAAKTAEGISHVPTEYVEKLADAVDYIADELRKEGEQGNVQQPGTGPNALPVLEATSSETNIDAGQLGSATAKHQPAAPVTQTEQVQSGKADTGMATNDDAMRPEQPVEPISNEKAALASANLSRLLRFGQATEESKLSHVPVRLIRKYAEDAINQANISGGAAVPPDASASEEGVPSQPSDVTGQQRMVSSNDAAINYTKGQAKADPKKDVNQVLEEPALSSATDKVLQRTLDNTGQAGVKISMAEDTLKVAAARTLLTKLAEEACGDKKKPAEKKEKQSQFGMGSGTQASPPPPGVPSPQFTQ